MPFRFVSIHGAPRSGTSWLGKIFDSHPDVAYRYQPLFAYRFKGALTPRSGPQEVRSFLEKLYAVTDDDFILQRRQAIRGAHPPAVAKVLPAKVLVMKEVRYHEVIPAILDAVPGAKVIGIVRDPCGTLNSWLKTPREFDPAWRIEDEWRDAPSKNGGRPEEYFGFTRWKELARAFLALERARPASFYLLRYRTLVGAPLEETRRLFAFCGLDVPESVHAFLERSQQFEVNDPDSVFRHPDVRDRWQAELPRAIREAVEGELRGTDLETFL